MPAVFASSWALIFGDMRRMTCRKGGCLTLSSTSTVMVSVHLVGGDVAAARLAIRACSTVAVLCAREACLSSLQFASAVGAYDMPQLALAE